MSVKKATAAEAYGKDKAKLQFLFDYGDEWLFKTERGLNRQTKTIPTF